MAESHIDASNLKSSFKATSLFGGVQVYNIIVNIIRSKIIAVLLGPYGMGISGLYTATTGLISSITNLGLSTSAVKDIAEANSTGNFDKISVVVSVFRKLLWITGILGLLVCLCFSQQLSQLTFGSGDYTIGFVWLSITLLVQQLTLGQTTLLQGMRKYVYMAKSQVIGSTIGLFVTIPLYYLYNIDAIVPVLIISSLISLLLSIYYSNKLGVKSVPICKSTLVSNGTGMLKMGFLISMGGILSQAASYVVRVVITNYGSIDDVGLYNAGFAIINTYVGLVFTAMTTDYYPRLSSACKDNNLFNSILNNQLYLAILIVGPLIVFFIIYIPIIVQILYSSKFSPIEDMMVWAVFAILFKAYSWAIAFTILAKGDSFFFFVNELSANVYMLLLNIICYIIMGLNGLGISFLLGYLLYSIQVLILCKNKYDLTIDSAIYKNMLFLFFAIVFCVSLTFLNNVYLKYVGGSISILIVSIYSFYKVNKVIDISSFIKRKLSK